MGNRAIIRGKGQGLGVYVHWNGSFDSVYAFTKYCKLKGYRSPEDDSYGIARLCQVIGNFFGGGLSVGVVQLEKELTPEYVENLWLDNGVYEIRDWEIVKHWNCKPITGEVAGHEYDINDFLVAIDKKMPQEEQLGKNFILAEEVKTESLNVGDRVFFPVGYDGGHYEIHTIMGFAEGEHVCGYYMEYCPYVDRYPNGGGNINNYIRSETIKLFKKSDEEIPRF